MLRGGGGGGMVQVVLPDLKCLRGRQPRVCCVCACVFGGVAGGFLSLFHSDGCDVGVVVAFDRIKDCSTRAVANHEDWKIRRVQTKLNAVISSLQEQ